jgi:hypothetical protein
MSFPIIYVVTRNSNGVYKSVDAGAAFVQIGTNALTAEVTDVALSDRPETHSVITYGDGAATTPYYSFNDGITYQAGQNTVGKEVTYVGQLTYVFGATKTASGSGSVLEMSFNEGLSISATIDVAPLFNYPGAVYSNITVTGFDFTNSAGGYITVAGNQNNSSADQILTRTFDRGVSFPDALILPGNMGIIRSVWVSPERNIVFAIGEPDTIRGALYSINPSLTEAPVKVLDGITVGSIINDISVKFASVPPTYNTDSLFEDPSIQYLKFRSKVYFLDSAGRVYYSDDYGFTWQFRSQVPGVCVDIIAINENTVLVLSNSPTSVFKSVDGGVTFIENPQPSWVDPRAMTHVASADCSTCNPGFTPTASVQGFCTRSDRYVGTLCKSPYVYSEFLAACAKPSTIVPTNLIISIDYSQSVDAGERFLFRKYIELLISKLEDRLLDGSMKIAIIGWSSQACLQQTFTSDINQLYTILYTDPPSVAGAGCFQNGTNHTEAMCLAIRTLYEESVLRPDAENVLALFTDGTNGFKANPLSYSNCDLSDIGLLPIVPSDLSPDVSGWNNEQTDMYVLVKNAKEQLNNGVGFKIIATILGNTIERENARDFLITIPANKSGLGPAFAVPTQIPNSNRYYFLDGGKFDDAQFIADQIRLGLAAEIISSPVCPNGCEAKAGIDNLGYCACNELIGWTDCTYDIENCETGEIIPVKSQQGLLFPDTVVRLRGKGAVDSNLSPWFDDNGAGCWKVIETGITNPAFFYVRPNQNFGGIAGYTDCPTCLNPNWYKCTDCLENTFSVYTRNVEFQKLLDNGENVITHTNYPDRCFLIENIGASGTYAESGITISGIDFRGPDCPSCPRQAYCDGFTNDLQAYIGQVVNIQGFGAQCWLVELNPSPPTSNQDVVVTNSYADCIGCLPVAIYAFTNCQDPTVVVYTRQDFSQYVGTWVRLQEYQGICWLVSQTNIVPPSISTLTIDGPSFLDCPSCIVTYYQLTNCANPDVFLISTSTELSRYVGRTITAAGYTGLCFTVTPPQCNCIRATINGVEYDAYVESAQFNGRNIYYITTDSGDELAIAWSINPNQWELFDRNTSATLGFSTTDNDCPFSNFWTIVQGSPYIITTVSFCADRIYNIAPELDFADCEPCINCI